MSQPCVKFIAFTSSYLAFVFMIAASSLNFAEEEIHREQFSIHYFKYAQNLSDYFNNSKLDYRVNTPDFFIRNDSPTNLDLAIVIWLFGILFFSFLKPLLIFKTNLVK
jgi:hypothetical protein